MIKDFGLNTHVPSSKELTASKEVGCEYVRIDVDWRTVESKKGKYNFSNLDNAINSAKKLGFKVYVSVAYSPTWHRNNYQDLPDKFEWLLFLNKFVLRFQDKLDVVSIWNEPNLKGFGNFSINDYIKVLLEPSYHAIKKINPNIKVAAGDISTMSNSNWYEWTKEIRKNYTIYDIFAIHSYKDDIDELEMSFNTGKFFGILGLFFDKYKPYNKELDKIRNHGKEVWLTETGIPTNKVSESKQEKYYKELIEIKDKIKVNKIFGYELKDDKNIPEKWGIFDNNLNPKKSAQYLLNYNKEISK